MKAIEQTISPKIASTSESWLPIPKGSGKLPDIATAKHIPQQIRMEIMVLLHGQRAVLELQPVVIYACTYPRGKPLAEGKAVRGFQPPEQVFATERRAEKGCRTSGDTDKPIAVSPCRNDHSVKV